GKPILCAGCHASNALPGSGIAGISSLTSAEHTAHSQVVDPTQNLKLDDITNRSSCYMCHPGSVTKCLRGAMGNAVDGSGNALMGCQSCHGLMSDVGAATRTGWLQEPNCQACHHDGVRETSAIGSGTGTLRVVTDTRFATTANVPSSGYSLYRFSKGHGNLQCEACHGPTHAEYPSSTENDNVQSVALQGHRGTVRECTACHATVPSTTTGGPHGMHPPTQQWVQGHGNAAENNRTQCAYCHGSDYKGSYLSEVRQARNFTAKSRTVTFAVGQRISCYECHNGPGGDGSGGTLPPNMNPAYSGAAGTAISQADQTILNWLVGK
ncbi:MAG TPA: multiheme c-type cytochrome, partial [Rhodocyclaceae bacterium]|nr:multiheme c-type cytochrome [Rhodocyclaceae bacterium]